LNIVAISGKLYSGKTSLAKNLVQSNPRIYVKSLAGPLKEDIARLCGVNTTFINDNKERFRTALQWYGTEFRRWHNGENYWVDRIVEDMSKWLNDPLWLVDDVRFPNELFGLAEAADKSGGSFAAIRLEIDRITQIKRHLDKYQALPDEAIFLHPSETALDDVDPSVWDMVFDSALPADRILRSALDGLKKRGLVDGQPLG
jgi:phosphomevalonate kinase